MGCVLSSLFSRRRPEEDEENRHHKHSFPQPASLVEQPPLPEIPSVHAFDDHSDTLQVWPNESLEMQSILNRYLWYLGKGVANNDNAAPAARHEEEYRLAWNGNDKDIGICGRLDEIIQNCKVEAGQIAASTSTDGRSNQSKSLLKIQKWQKFFEDMKQQCDPQHYKALAIDDQLEAANALLNAINTQSIDDLMGDKRRNLMDAILSAMVTLYGDAVAKSEDSVLDPVFFVCSANPEEQEMLRKGLTQSPAGYLIQHDDQSNGALAPFVHFFEKVRKGEQKLPRRDDFCRALKNRQGDVFYPQESSTCVTEPLSELVHFETYHQNNPNHRDNPTWEALLTLPDGRSLSQGLAFHLHVRKLAEAIRDVGLQQEHFSFDASSLTPGFEEAMSDNMFNPYRQNSRPLNLIVALPENMNADALTPGSMAHNMLCVHPLLWRYMSGIVVVDKVTEHSAQVVAYLDASTKNIVCCNDSVLKWLGCAEAFVRSKIKQTSDEAAIQVCNEALAVILILKNQLDIRVENSVF
ncbi:MAG: hypothetical protein ABW189_03415 [Rickettsiales bacterium]